MNITRTRVILTGHNFFKFGFREPGCTSKLMADCPPEHKCMDYADYHNAINRAQGYANTHPLMERVRARRVRRGIQYAPGTVSRHRSGTAIWDLDTTTPTNQDTRNTR